MDMLDVFAVFGLEWVTDKIEDRYGRTVAWCATLVICLSFLGIVGAALYAML
jgi:Na+/proline symporter